MRFIERGFLEKRERKRPLFTEHLGGLGALQKVQRPVLSQALEGKHSNGTCTLSKGRWYNQCKGAELGAGSSEVGEKGD